MLYADSDYAQELAPLFRLILLLLGAGGLLLALGAEFMFGSFWPQVLELALLCWVIAGGGLLLLHRHEIAGRWFTVVALAALVLLTAWRLHDPALLAWLVLPNLLAVAFLSVRAGLLLATLQTLLLVAAGAVGASETNYVVVGLIWALLTVAALLTQTLHQVYLWSLEHSRHATDVLQEARQQRQELNQAVADLSQANRQLAQLNRLAQSLRQTADEALATKERFVSNVSHELRTPLNMIIGFSETMLESPTLYGAHVPPALLADLTVIRRNAEHLSSLIDDVLDLNQSELGEMTLSREFVCYSEIVAAAITAVQPLFASKQLYLRTEIIAGMGADLPPVYCDPLRIREVLMNLLSNAGRFTAEGGVSVRVWLEKEQLYTAVADTGFGIAADKLENLFQPFYQVDGSIRRRFGGTGLGLSISKRFIELHEGVIWAESREGQGTTFIFRLPVTLPERAPAGALQNIVPDWEFYAGRSPRTAPRAPQPPRYIVVDATHTLDRLVKRGEGYAEVVSAPTVEAALAELEQYPAQALLVNSPSPYTTLDALAVTPALPEGMPVLVCALAAGEAPEESLGVQRRLTKPVTRSALLAALQSLGVQQGTVLIVDDEPDALQLFGRIVTSCGGDYRILLARDGLEALAIMRSTAIDLILLDLIMPNLNGFQLLAHKAADPALAAIPVIVLSAQDATRQPMVANSLTFMRSGGISAGRLLKTIHATVQLLGDGAPAPAEDQLV